MKSSVLPLSEDQYWDLDFQAILDQLGDINDELALDYETFADVQIESARLLCLLKRREEIKESRNTLRTSLTYARTPTSSQYKGWSSVILLLLISLCVVAHTISRCL